MTRTPLPERRQSVTAELEHTRGNRTEKYTVGFGFDALGFIREVFLSSLKTGTDLQAFVNDACICMSFCLQHGDRIGDLAGAFGEDRAEGETSGPPSSVLGAIARAGAEVEGSRPKLVV